MVVVMVETEEAIATVREIIAVPGVDVVLIGPGDLMIDVKARGHDEEHHEHLALEVAAGSKQTGVAAGYVCPTAEIAERRLAQGCRFLNYGLDHFVLLGGFGEIRDQARRWAQA
jgi:4-hydroxy-2-oxoheptanedioate aldolase